jgi:chromosome segregation ATPase
VTLERSLENMNSENVGLQSRYVVVSEERESLENVLRTVQYEKGELDMKIEDQEREINELKELVSILVLTFENELLRYQILIFSNFP